ncbi:MAG TPA: sialate O-acetylesterase [Puia sp.]|jgi:sialate O-acetylesterase|nr:sialate O-acetylesterase [Puia sp.]
MKILIFMLAGFLLAFSVSAQIKMPGIFGDHMVIQRDRPVPVWGWSSPKEKLVLSFNQQKKEVIADRNGKWRVNLDPEAAGGPYILKVEGKNSLIFHDVMVGEVWICSGQSNMEFELKSARNANNEIMNSGYSEIRHIKIPLSLSSMAKEDIQPSAWNVCSPKTAGDFTAVGYFFAREIVKRLHVPVGLINSTWGGTMVEAWTSHAAFENSPEFKSIINSVPDKDFEVMMKEHRNKLENQVKLLQKNIIDTFPETNWKMPDYNNQTWPKISVALNWENQQLGLDDLDGIVWYRKEIFLDENAINKPVTLSLGKIDDNDETYVNGIWVGSSKNWAENRAYRVPVGIFKTGKNIIAVRVEDTGGGGGFYGDSSAVYLKSEDGFISLSDNWRFRIAKITRNVSGVGPNDYPSLLFNAMINPLIPYGIRGVLWYQGEANTGRAFQYRTAFPLMINDWRQHWDEGNFPFYFVQLASFNSDNGNSLQGSTWAELREAQTRTLSLPATGMSVTTDIGESNDIHPKNKQDVGLRLAAIAMNNIYNQPEEYCGPVYESMSVLGDKVILSFTHTGSGLIVKDKYGYLRGFEIAGSDHHFYYAKAILQNNKVIVYANEVSKPESIHFAWADDAGDANLYNKEGFPAVPFRTDQWKGVTDDKKFEIGKP